MAAADAREVTIVVPCFNEARRLRIDSFVAFASRQTRVGFIFVDDGSSDGTALLIAEASELGGPGLEGLVLAGNRGKAEAVRLGILKAIDGGAGIVGYLDADLATPLEELARMVGLMEASPKLDGVLGSRVRLLGRDIERRPHRHYLGRVFASVASLVLGLPVYDTQCGAKLFRVNSALRQALEKPFNSRWIFDVELIARLRRSGSPDFEDRIEEYPLRKWRDVEGSKLRMRDMARAGLELVRIAADGRSRGDRI